MSKQMNSPEIIEALRLKYCQPEWAFFTEVPNGTGYQANRRADAIAMNMWPSRGLELRVFEVKVSRSDLITELKQPAKAEAFRQYCDSFYLVTPCGLTKGLDIPKGWGVLEITKGGVRLKTECERNENPKPLDRSFIAGLMRSAAKVTEAEILRATETQLCAALRAARKDHDLALALAERKFEREMQTYKSIITELKSILGIHFDSTLKSEPFLHAVALVHKLGPGHIVHNKTLARLNDDLDAVARTANELRGVIQSHQAGLGVKAE